MCVCRNSIMSTVVFAIVASARHHVLKVQLDGRENIVDIGREEEGMSCQKTH